MAVRKAATRYRELCKRRKPHGHECGICAKPKRYKQKELAKLRKREEDD